MHIKIQSHFKSPALFFIPLSLSNKAKYEEEKRFCLICIWCKSHSYTVLMQLHHTMKYFSKSYTALRIPHKTCIFL